MATQTELTGAELIFAQRMLPHFMAGKSAVEAAQAVLEDDARLFNAVAGQSVLNMDGSYTKMPFRVEGLRNEITARVYSGLRAEV